MPSPKRFVVVLTLLAALIALSACDTSLTFSRDVEAVGELVTVPFELEDFDSIVVQSSFEAFVEVGDSPFVEIVVNESLVEDLDVWVRNGELKIGLKNGVMVRNGTLEATVRMPELSKVEVAGASSTEITGVVGPSLDLRLSGASDLTVEGSAESLTVRASGASAVDVRLDEVHDVVVDLSGASSLELDHVVRASGEMSGASEMSLPAEAVLDVETSGASHITGR